MNLPIFKSRYFWFALGVAFVYQAMALIVYTFYPQKLSLVWSEGNVGENIAAVAWGVGAVCSLTKLFFFMGKDDAWAMWLWCFFASFLGATRELDMHKKLDEISGITWKSEFLNDPSVSIVLKVVLVACMLTLVIGMLGSVAYKHRSIIRELKAGNVMISIFLLGLIYMAVGFSLDGSVLGKKLFFPIITRSFAKLAEESFETIAAVLACLSVLPFFFRKNAIPDHP
jgi:hypothetical protein